MITVLWIAIIVLLIIIGFLLWVLWDFVYELTCIYHGITPKRYQEQIKKELPIGIIGITT